MSTSCYFKGPFFRVVEFIIFWIIEWRLEALPGKAAVTFQPWLDDWLWLSASSCSWISVARTFSHRGCFFVLLYCTAYFDKTGLFHGLMCFSYVFFATISASVILLEPDIPMHVYPKSACKSKFSSYYVLPNSVFSDTTLFITDFRSWSLTLARGDIGSGLECRVWAKAPTRGS